MWVNIFDGSRVETDDRVHAIGIVKEFLGYWMQPGDYITWRYSSPDLQLPNIAVVMNELNEETDASAMITEG